MRFFQKWSYAFHGAVLIYAGLLITMSTVTIAQSSLSTYRADIIEARVEKLEDLNLDRRLAVMENLLQDLKIEVKESSKKDMLDWASGGGVGLILLRLGYEAVRNLKKKGNVNDPII